MRPINKGINNKIYRDYRDAKWDLVEKLGHYCSYCEMNIQNQADVEHVVPKTKNENLILEWDNLLLGCKTCNTVKNSINESREGYPFPDEYNTAYLYEYKNGKVQINEELSETEYEMAKKLFELIKLNREYNSSKRADDRDIARMHAFEKAKMSLKDYVEAPISQMVNQISRSPEGFFSVWLEVFKDYPEVKKAILEAVPGTALECYDDKFNPKKIIKRK